MIKSNSLSITFIDELFLFYRKAVAFLRRDLLTETSYKFSFSLSIFGIISSVLMFYFIAKLFGKAAAPYLKSYEDGYFPFVLLGIAFHGYLGTAMNSFSGVIRQGQITGTLEAMLVTPTKVSTIIILSSLWSYLSTSIEVLVYLALGIFLGVDFSHANLLSFLVIFALTIISFSSIGFISAGFILIFKRGDPLSLAIGGLSGLLGGVYYPITILPSWLQTFSYLLPITYSLNAIRQSLLNNASITSLITEISALLLFTVIALPVGILFFRYGVKRAKVNGSLAYY